MDSMAVTVLSQKNSSINKYLLSVAKIHTTGWGTVCISGKIVLQEPENLQEIVRLILRKPFIRLKIQLRSVR